MEKFPTEDSKFHGEFDRPTKPLSKHTSGETYDNSSSTIILIRLQAIHMAICLFDPCDQRAPDL